MLGATLLLVGAFLVGQPPQPTKCFSITVVDEQTGRGVPLVELRTVNGIRLVTDSNGIVAFDEPGLMGQAVFFHVVSHGYEFPKDGFGFRGKQLQVEAGGKAPLTIRRLNIAERLYRATGGGIYRDSVLVGAKVPLQEPVLNGQVFGSDSVVNAVYRDKIYWFWGDTNRPAYPLGNFHVPGAVSALPSKGGLDPEVGVDLRYFVDKKGFARPTAQMPGKGLTWLTSVAALKDHNGRERLYASFVKVEAPMTVYARGLAVFDDAKDQFVKLADIDMKAPAYPDGHAMIHHNEDIDHLYFSHPFPLTRVRATAEHFQRPEAYEAFTCLRSGSRLEDPQLDRDAQGKLRYAWRKNASPLGPADEVKLVKQKKIKAEETRWQLRDKSNGKAVQPHSGSVYWNAFRGRWVMIAVQSWGTSLLGEVWYAEADTPVGPWSYAVKIVTHDRYSFYNPKQHPMFDKEGGRFIFFEGTYTHTFSGNSDVTPRYDYNQILYKLDLADPRLVLPVAVYDVGPEEAPGVLAMKPALKGKPARVAFFAPDRPFPGSTPIQVENNGFRLGKAEDNKPLFYAVPADAKAPPPATVPLYEYRPKDGGRRAYSLNPELSLPGFERGAKPLCRVWR